MRACVRGALSFVAQCGPVTRVAAVDIPQVCSLTGLGVEGWVLFVPLG